MPLVRPAAPRSKRPNSQARSAPRARDRHRRRCPQGPLGRVHADLDGDRRPRRISPRCRGAPRGPGRAGRRRRRRASRRARRRAQRPRRRPRASQARWTRGADREDLGRRAAAAPGLEPRHGQRAGGPSAYSRSACSAMIARRGSGRSSPAARRRRGCSVSGVCRLWLTPRRKSSLPRSADELRILVLDLVEQLGIPDRDRDLAGDTGRGGPGRRSQVRVAGSRPTMSPSAPRRRATRRGSGRDRRGSLLGSATSPGPRAGRPRRSCRRPTRRACGKVGQASIPWRGAAAVIAARIRPSSRLRRSRSPASRLWLSRAWASSSSPATDPLVRSPRDTWSPRSDLAQRGPRSAGEQQGEEHAEATARRQPETSTGASAPARASRPRTRGAGRARSAEREHRGADQGDREAEPERQPRADPGSRRRGGRGIAAVSPVGRALKRQSARGSSSLRRAAGSVADEPVADAAHRQTWSGRLGSTSTSGAAGAS